MSGAHEGHDQTGDERELHVVPVERVGEGQVHDSVSNQSGRSSWWIPRLTPVAARSAGGPSNSTRRFSTTTRSRSSATAPSSCDTSTTAPAAIADDVYEGVPEEALRLRVHAGDRLVEDEQLRFRGESLGDQDALLLPTRQLANRAAAEIAERDGVDRGIDRQRDPHARGVATTRAGRDDRRTRAR